MYDQKLKEKLQNELKSRQEMIKYMFSQRVNFYNYHGESPIYIYNLLTGKITEKTDKEEMLTMCLMPALVRSIYIMFYTREAAEEYKWLFEAIDGWVEYSIQNQINKHTNCFARMSGFSLENEFTVIPPLFANDEINVYLEENKYKKVRADEKYLKGVNEVHV